MDKYVKFTGGKMIMHMNLGSKGAKHSYSYEIVAVGHPLHGKTMIRSVDLPKLKGVWQQQTDLWHVIDTDKVEPVFETLPELIAHYNLPPLKPKEVKDGK